jgi:hypothetical protein
MWSSGNIGGFPVRLVDIVEATRSQPLDYALVTSHCESEGLTLQEFCNEFSTLVAAAHKREGWSLDDCGAALSSLFDFMIRSDVLDAFDGKLPQPAGAICMAFS